MKKSAILGLATIISIVLTNIPTKVNSAPKVLTDWEKSRADWNELLTEVPAPPSFGNTLVDATGGKNNCRTMSPGRNRENREVVNLICWGEKDRTFPPLAAQWVKSNSELIIAASHYPMPLSAGNMLTDSRNRKYDCHLTNYLINNQKNPVSEWACWSAITYKPI